MGSRFDCPSAALSLKTVLKKGRKVMLMAWLLALGVHVSFSQMVGSKSETEIAKPLTTKFVKRTPRLTKPLELKKRVRPKRQMMQRQMVSIKAKVSREGISSNMRSVQVLRSLSSPKASIERSIALGASVSMPEAVAAAIQGSREFEKRVDMSLEMMDIDALDTGKYHAMVFVDPDDKRNIQGFFHMAIAYSTNAGDPSLGGHYFERPMALPNLVEAVNYYTNIKMDISGAYPYDSVELFKIPFIYNAVSSRVGHPFRITTSEARNLGKYLLAGGFFMIEDAWPDLDGPSNFDARKTLKDALAAVGLDYQKDWNFEKIPNDHELYHCYFDFNGPPMGGDYQMIIDPTRGSPPDFIEGIFRQGRLIAIMSNKDYEDVWAHQAGFNNIKIKKLAIRTYQFGVNVIVFALTQEGSITTRVMDVVK